MPSVAGRVSFRGEMNTNTIPQKYLVADVIIIGLYGPLRSLSLTFVCEAPTKYLAANYIRPREEKLSEYGLSVKKTYGRLVALLDEFKSIRKAKKDQGLNLPLAADPM